VCIVYIDVCDIIWPLPRAGLAHAMPAQPCHYVSVCMYAICMYVYLVYLPLFIAVIVVTFVVIWRHLALFATQRLPFATFLPCYLVAITVMYTICSIIHCSLLWPFITPYWALWLLLRCYAGVFNIVVPTMTTCHSALPRWHSLLLTL